MQESLFSIFARSPQTCISVAPLIEYGICWKAAASEFYGLGFHTTRPLSVGPTAAMCHPGLPRRTHPWFPEQLLVWLVALFPYQSGDCSVMVLLNKLSLVGVLKTWPVQWGVVSSRAANCPSDLKQLLIFMAWKLGRRPNIRKLEADEFAFSTCE